MQRRNLVLKLKSLLPCTHSHKAINKQFPDVITSLEAEGSLSCTEWCAHAQPSTSNVYPPLDMTSLEQLSKPEDALDLDWPKSGSDGEF